MWKLVAWLLGRVLIQLDHFNFGRRKSEDVCLCDVVHLLSVQRRSMSNRVTLAALTRDFLRYRQIVSSIFGVIIDLLIHRSAAATLETNEDFVCTSIGRSSPRRVVSDDAVI